MTPIEILETSEALLTGHFLYTSGRHGHQYMQCAKVLQNPAYATAIIEHLTTQFAALNPELVIAPAMGGILVGHELARQLGTRSIFAERENGLITLRRGFTIPTGTRTLIAEDVVNTGKSVREVMAITEAAGADLIGVAALVDRTGGTIDFGVPFYSAYSTQMVSYAAEDCPICAEGKLPLVKPGSRVQPS